MNKKEQKLGYLCCDYMEISCAVKGCGETIGRLGDVEFRGYKKNKEFYIKIGKIYCEKHKRYAK